MATDGSLETRLKELTQRLQAVEQRLATLERRGLGGPSPEQEEQEREDRAAAEPLVTVGALPLVGRSLLVLGGAFLLRALTEAGILPQAAGSFVGLGYAILWLVVADRVAARERLGNATFHGLTTALIAFPLLWEATVQFEFLDPLASAGALLATAMAGLGVAWRHDLPRLAWVVVGGATPTAVALAFATATPAPFLACLLALGLAALWLGYLKGWAGLGWLVALVVDAVFLNMTTAMALSSEAAFLGEMTPMTLVALQAAMVLVYLGSLGAHTLALGRTVGYPEMGQAVLATGIGLGGLVVIAHGAGVGLTLLGAPVLLLGAGSYVVAFALVRPRRGTDRTFHFYASCGLALLLAAVPLILTTTTTTTVAFAAGGIACGALGWRSRRDVLALHGTLYLLAATLASGLIVEVVDAYVGSAGTLVGWLEVPVLVALVAVVAGSAFPLTGPRSGWRALARVAGALLAALLMLSTGALIVALGSAWLPHTADGTVAPAGLSTLRTGVLAAAAVALMGAGHGTRWSDLRWLSYGLVVIGALKLLLEDLRVGHAATLFPSLALYGGALIVVSRLASRQRKRSKSASGHESVDDEPKGELEAADEASAS